MSRVNDRVKKLMKQEGGAKKTARRGPMSPDEVLERVQRESSQRTDSNQRQTHSSEDDFPAPRRKKKRKKLFRRKRPGKWVPNWWQKILLTVGFLLIIYMLARISVGLIGSWQAAVTSTINTDTGELRQYTHDEYLAYAQRHSKKAVSATQIVERATKYNISLKQAEKELVWSGVKQVLVVMTGWMFTGNHWSFKAWSAFSMNFSLFLIAVVLGLMLAWWLVGEYRDAKWEHNEKEQWIYIAWQALPRWKLAGGVVAFAVGVLQGAGSFRAWYLKAFLVVVAGLVLLNVLKRRSTRRAFYRLQEAVDLEKLSPDLAEWLNKRKCKESDFQYRGRRWGRRRWR